MTMLIRSYYLYYWYGYVRNTKLLFIIFPSIDGFINRAPNAKMLYKYVNYYHIQCILILRVNICTRYIQETKVLA